MKVNDRFKLEQAVLGKLMLEQDPTQIEKAFEILAQKPLAGSRHRAAFDAAFALAKNGQPHGFDDVIKRCEADGTLNRAGGEFYVRGLLLKVERDNRGLVDCANRLSTDNEPAAMAPDKAGVRSETTTPAEPTPSEADHDQSGKSVRSKPKREVILRRMSDIEPKPLRWLWPGFLPLAKLSLIGGDPGLGKSMLTLDLAARVSTGSPWPDGSQCPRGEAILLNAEDDPEDTIRPRLDAAQANPEKVHELFAVRETNGSESMFSLEKDVALLEATLIANPDVVLVVIDPISAYLGKSDSYRETDIRNILSPLQALAAEYDVSIIYVTHLNKNSGASAVYRMTGSTAFVGVARAVFAVDKDPDDKDRRFFAPVKANLSIDCVGMAYRVTTTNEGIPRIEWESEPIAISAQDLLCAGPDRGEASEAEEFLRDALDGGEQIPVTDIFRTGKEQGFSEKQLRIAKEKIGAQHKRTGFQGKSVWYLPSYIPSDAIHPLSPDKGM